MSSFIAWPRSSSCAAADLTGCIVNKGFVGSGERLESGTIAPDVTRERKDAPP